MQTRTTLAETIAEKNGLSKKAARKIVDDVFAAIAAEISAKDGEVRISDFGTFSNVVRAEKAGVNPQTKEKITIPAKTVPHFKAGKALKDAVSAGCGGKKKGKKK